MTAAEITPSVVQKTYVASTGKTGVPMRLVKYTFKVTKVSDADWMLATAFQTGNPIYWNACAIDASGNGVQEGTVGMTYTLVGTKITLSGGTVGTVYGEIWFEE